LDQGDDTEFGSYQLSIKSALRGASARPCDGGSLAATHRYDQRDAESLIRLNELAARRDQD